jgi:hypothetical protein
MYVCMYVERILSLRTVCDHVYMCACMLVCVCVCVLVITALGQQTICEWMFAYACIHACMYIYTYIIIHASPHKRAITHAYPHERTHTMHKWAQPQYITITQVSHCPPHTHTQSHLPLVYVFALSSARIVSEPLTAPSGRASPTTGRRRGRWGGWGGWGG